MPKILWNYFLAIPALFSGISVLSTAVNATEVQTKTESAQEAQSEIQYIAPNIQPEFKPDVFKTTPSNLIAQVPVANTDVEQVTSVSQLSDVQPTDWAFQALQSLVERYGVIAGYPDGTFKGNRALTRYEFAAGLNAALDRLNELIASSTADLVKREDLETLKRLQEQFSTELATLRGRVDSIEARTAKLEATQFSTTTKLQGLAQFFIADAFGNTVGSNRDNSTTTFSYRVRLALQSSFTGKDQLTTSLSAANVPVLGGAAAQGGTPVTGTSQTRFNVEINTFYPAGSVYLDRLFYRFPLGSKTTVWIGPRALAPVVFLTNSNPLIGNTETGTLTRFGLFNPIIYRPGFDGAGLGFAHKFNNQLQLNGGYIVDDGEANNPGTTGRITGGLFGNSYEAVGQLTFTPSRSLDISFAYARKYFPAPIVPAAGTTVYPFGYGYVITGGTGTANAGRPFGVQPTSSDNFGLQFNWKTSRALHIGGWVGYTEAHQEGSSNNATIINAALTLALPDLGKKGNLAGFVFGIPPKVTSNDVVAGRDKDTSLHIEGFYTHRVNDNISVTPTLYVITNPQGNSANEAIWVGAVRTTFNF